MSSVVTVNQKIVPSSLAYNNIVVNGEETVLYLYSLCSVMDDDTTRHIIHECESCFPYLHSLNQVGIAIPHKIPDEALKNNGIDFAINMNLRSSSTLTTKLVYMGSHSIPCKILGFMQRFHRAVVCWDVNATSTSIMHPESWSVSSNGSYYIIFPVAPWCNEGNIFTVKGGNTYNNMYCNVAQPTKEFYVDEVRNMVHSFPPPNWEEFLEKSANEAEQLVRNMSQYRQQGFGFDLQHPTSPPLIHPCYFPPVTHTSSLSDTFIPGPGSDIHPSMRIPTPDAFAGKIVGGKFGRLFVGLSNHPACIKVTLHTHKSLVKKRKAGVNAVRVEEETSDGVTLEDKSFEDVFLEENPQISRRQLQELKCTCCGCVNRFVGSLGAQGVAVDGLKGVSVGLEHSCDMELVPMSSLTGNCTCVPWTENINSTNAPPSVTSNSNHVEAGNTPTILVPHRHSDVQYYLPSTLMILGEAIWMYVGLVTPAVMWRLHGLLLAYECKLAIYGELILMNKSAREIERVKLLSDVSADNAVLDSMLTTSAQSPAQFLLNNALTIPPGMLLEAMTATCATENINNELYEYMGDAVLRILVSIALMTQYPAESVKEWVDMRVKYTCNAHLEKQSTELQLIEYLRGLRYCNGNGELAVFPPGLSIDALHSLQSGSDRLLAKYSLLNKCVTLCYEDIVEYQSIYPDTCSFTTTTSDANATTTMTAASISSSSSSSITYQHRKKRKREMDSSSSMTHAAVQHPLYHHGYSIQCKAKADYMEALVGVYYCHCKDLKQMMIFIDRFGLSPSNIQNSSASTTSSNVSRDPIVSGLINVNAANIADQGKQSIHLLAEQYLQSIRSEMKGMELSGKVKQQMTQLQGQLRYTFHTPSLLFSIIHRIHPMKSGDCSVHHRLQFIGDAVLDWVIASLVHEGNPALLAGDRSIIKQTARNSFVLARLAVNLGVHKYIITTDKKLQYQLDMLQPVDMNEVYYQWICDTKHVKVGTIHTNFVRYFCNQQWREKEWKNMSSSSSSTVLNGPLEKLLANCMEAVIGAVYIDCMDMMPMYDMIRQLKVLPYFP